MVTEAVWNHPSPLLPQVNSKGFFTLMQLHIVCVQHRHLTTPVFDDLHKEDPSGRGWVLFLWLFGFGLCACVCARVYVDFLGRT